MRVERTNNTPEIIYNKEDCKISFKGASYPENANYFYEPIKSNFSECLRKLNGKGKSVDILLAFTLLNSISTRYIYEFLRIANTYSKINKPINVNWYYEYDDDDMKLDGQIFKNEFKNLKFKIIPLDDIDTIILFNQ